MNPLRSFAAAAGGMPDAMKPPSTTRTVPVTKHASSDLRLSVATHRYGTPPGFTDGGVVLALRQRRLDRPGGNRIDANAVIGELRRHHLGQCHHSRFGGAVGGAPGIAAQSRHACDIDDDASTLFRHRLRAGLADVKAAVKVGLENQIEQLGRGLQERRDAADPGTMHEVVDPSVVSQDSADERSHAVLPGYVDAKGMNSRTGAERGRCGGNIGGHDDMSVARHPAGHGGTDAGLSAGHERDLFSSIVHGALPAVRQSSNRRRRPMPRH
jgi:hypothetical protein